MSVSVNIKPAELQRALRNIDKWSDNRRKAVRDAINKTGLRVESDAKRNCPVDTGRLRSSIRSKVARTVKDPVYVWTDVEYAAFVEYGTGQRGAASGTSPPRGYEHGGSVGMRAQPYLVPAAEANRRRFVADLKKALKV